MNLPDELMNEHSWDTIDPSYISRQVHQGTIEGIRNGAKMTVGCTPIVSTCQAASPSAVQLQRLDNLTYEQENKLPQLVQKDLQGLTLPQQQGQSALGMSLVQDASKLQRYIPNVTVNARPSGQIDSPVGLIQRTHVNVIAEAEVVHNEIEDMANSSILAQTTSTLQQPLLQPADQQQQDSDHFILSEGQLQVWLFSPNITSMYFYSASMIGSLTMNAFVL